MPKIGYRPKFCSLEIGQLDRIMEKKDSFGKIVLFYKLSISSKNAIFNREISVLVAAKRALVLLKKRFIYHKDRFL